MAAEMLELMYAHEGVGLAANQVALPLRMFVVNPAGKQGEGEELVLINPVLQRPKGRESDREGCLSLPGLYGEVVRAKQISLSAYDLQGNPIERRCEGFLARILQHENDHLDGVMFFDRMSDAARRELEPTLEEFEIDFESRQKGGGIASEQALNEHHQGLIQRYA